MATIIYGPRACGKTLMAKEFASLYNCDVIIDGPKANQSVTDSTLIITNNLDAVDIASTDKVLPFGQALYEWKQDIVKAIAKLESVLDDNFNG